MSRLGDGAVALARRAHDQADRAPSGDLGANVEAELLEGALEGHVQAAVEFPRGRAARVAAPLTSSRQDVTLLIRVLSTW